VQVAHVTFDVGMIEEDTLAEARCSTAVDRGMEGDQQSDMCLMPDPVTATIDPFSPRPPWSSATCSNRPQASPTTATRGMPEGGSDGGVTGVGDTIFFGPEAEFFVFDDVSFAAELYNTGFCRSSNCRPTPVPNTKAAIRPSHLAPRAATPGAAAVRQDMRSECWGPWPRWASRSKHHHEVASAQHEPA
jgi:glutamine synthetase